MTIISIMLLGLSIYIFASRKQVANSVFWLLFFCINNINIGYFMILGGVVISYTDVLTLLTFCICLCLAIKKHRVNQRLAEVILLLILVIFAGLFRLIIDPPTARVVSYAGNWDSYFRGNNSMMQAVSFSKQSVLQFIRAILFFFILLILKNNLEDDDWKLILRKLVVSTRWMLPVYVIEAVLMFIHTNIYYVLRNRLFGGVFMLSEGRLSGLTTEPSYYAISIFFIVTLNLLFKKDDDVKERRMRIITCTIYTILGVLSGALSFLWTGALIALLYLVKNNRLSKKMIMGFVLLLSVFLLFSNYSVSIPLAPMEGLGFTKRIENLINSVINFSRSGVMQYSSEGTRMGSIIIVMKAWAERPLFGLGLGTTSCFSGLFSILSTVGIIGLILWYMLIFHIYPNHKADIIFNVIFILVFLPAGDFEMFYGFNAVLWIELTSRLKLYHGQEKKLCYEN